MFNMSFQNPKIAVVSLAGIFPGAPDTDQFITNILEKKEAIVKVPNHRWAAPSQVMVTENDQAPTKDRAASDRAGLITDFQFDPSRFDLDNDLLTCLDPVHHLVLSAGQQAISQCRLTESLKKRTGVILAAIALPTDRSSRICHDIYLESQPVPLSQFKALGATVVSTPAAILARALGLQGGCFTLDAACASSLFAIKLACEHLMLNKADVMVAGGVSRPDSLYTQVGFTQLQALSPTGRCAPFDKDANGLVVGEGTGLVVLKRFDDALACKDQIHGIITGWGVSNDIEGNLVAPASEGQLRAMTAAYEMAGWSPADIQYMECHGSGTPKGDQVEITSIKTLLGQFGCPDTPLSIGSVKSTIGHLLTAAGAAGFIKTLAAMNLKTLPPSLNFIAPPEHSPIHDTRIKVQSDPASWEAGSTPRRAGISAFGFGGINAHILVEEFRPASSFHVVPDSLPQPKRQVPLAIIGMDALSGAAENLDDLQHLIFGDTCYQPSPAALRWRRTTHLPSHLRETRALFLDGLWLDLKDFHIPPNQMSDILPQHLTMLKVAKGALQDAGIPPRPGLTDPPRHRIGCAMGIDFDFGATDFYLRWHLHDLPESALDQICPALSFDRTLGALGGIVASRIAREFKLGGPCFTLSAGSASGMKSIETALHSLCSGETDIFLCGAVDLAGDIRSFTLNHTLSGVDEALLPSEGAAALVLKRLDQAVADNDRIYGTITGSGSASGANFNGELQHQGTQVSANRHEIYATSLENALARADKSLSNLAMVTVQGHPDNTNGRSEHLGINILAKKNSRSDMSADSKTTPRIFCPALAFGDTGAVSGLFSIVATSLCLYHGRLPAHMVSDGNCQPDLRSSFHAAVGSLTLDGASTHVVLSSYSSDDEQPARTKISHNSRKKPDLLIPVTRPPISEDLVRMICAQYPKRSKEHEQMTVIAREDPAVPIAGLAVTALTDPDLLIRTHEITARTHERFLEFSSRNMAEMGRQLATLALADPIPESPAEKTTPQKAFLDRDKCLEFAVGKAGNVLGPEFDIIDTYPVRVRLPGEPLMLVDRIMDIQGEMLSLTAGSIITQHDVVEGAWYLDGGKAPVAISIEAGQADLFLSSYLGIDHVIKGTRKYRLLDARVTFHRTLPNPGETIEYHIKIDRFLRQGDIYLFFFHYKGYIDGHLFISMRDGCAGFFTEDEVKNSGGIILKKEDRQQEEAKSRVSALVAMKPEAYSDDKVDALRRGDLETAFGPAFKGVIPGQNQWLPGGKMTLIHRVVELDPSGGRFGLGRIRAEADIHPEDWFLTCHFIDDMVMPGTLMYECCAHTLRVFVQRMGWVLASEEVHYDVLPQNESDLKCRGPVTRETQKARYDIEIKEMGYGPEPYVIADAHMFSDGLEIVLYKDMGMKLVGVSQQDLLTFWGK